MRHLFLLFIIVLAFESKAQTFNGGGGTIPDNGPPTFFSINVNGLSPGNIDTTFGVESVCINIQHNNDYQLTIQLVSPDGTTIDLSMNNGGTGNNYTNTCFTGSATQSIVNGNPPFTGSYRSQGVLGNVNNGQAGNGIWRLKVQDHNFGTTGSVVAWSITFGNSPAMPFIFSSSNLPIVVLDTYGQTIVDDPKKIIHMGIIDNGPGIRNYMTDPFNSYNGNIAIGSRAGQLNQAWNAIAIFLKVDQ